MVLDHVSDVYSTFTELPPEFSLHISLKKVGNEEYDFLARSLSSLDQQWKTDSTVSCQEGLNQGCPKKVPCERSTELLLPLEGSGDDAERVTLYFLISEELFEEERELYTEKRETYKHHP